MKALTVFKINDYYIDKITRKKNKDEENPTNVFFIITNSCGKEPDCSKCD